MAFSPRNINIDNICNSDKYIPLTPQNILSNHSSPKQSSTILTSTVDDASLATLIMPKPIPPLATPRLSSIQTPSAEPAHSILSGLTINDSTKFSRTSSSWKAARDSVLSQMITTQDIVTPVTVPRKNVKTGGRRGRGGRGLANKDERQKNGAEALDIENAVGTTGDVPGRAKGKVRSRGGGRPRVRSTNGLPRGTKRNRAQSEDEAKLRNDGSDSSETFTPLPAQSRSGRRIFRANTFAPMVVDLEANIEPKRSPAKGSAATATAGQGKTGKKPNGKSGDASVCKNCGRGHSPMSNMIVFCDGCNTPWHQHCHDEPISDDVVRIEEKEWFCADCEVLKEERVRLEGKVSAEGMSLVEVRHLFPLLSTRPLYGCLQNASSHRCNITEAALSSSTPPSSSRVSAPARHQPLSNPANLVGSSTSACLRPHCGGRGVSPIRRIGSASIPESWQRRLSSTRKRRSGALDRQRHGDF